MLFNIAFLVILPLFWIAADALNVYRLARFFQLEGYDSKRYLLWLSRQRGEVAYAVINLIGFIIIGVLAAVISEGPYGGIFVIPLIIAVFVVGIYNIIWI